MIDTNINSPPIFQPLFIRFISRITALNPLRECGKNFKENCSNLNSGDAQFVDVITTDLLDDFAGKSPMADVFIYVLRVENEFARNPLDIRSKCTIT